MRTLGKAVLGAALCLALVPGTTTAHADIVSAAQILQNGAQSSVTDGYPGAIGVVTDGVSGQYVTAGYGTLPSTAPDPTSQFRAGSATKTFVSTVILQLEAEGKLSLNDSVAKWLPNAVTANGYDGNKITIRMLLNHTSGLPDYIGNFNGLLGILDPNYPAAAVLGGNLNTAYTPQSLVDSALTEAPQTSPAAYPTSNPDGTHWKYANTNYILAGMIIQAVTHDDVANQLVTRILQPLGLTRTYLASGSTLSGSVFHGYMKQTYSTSLVDVTASNPQFFWTAGAMVSTLDDMRVFVQSLVSGRLLPPTQMTELETTVPIDAGTNPSYVPNVQAAYGLGIAHWQLPCSNGTVKGAWTHSGSVPGYVTRWITSEDGSKVVVIEGNENHLAEDTQPMWDQSNAAIQAICAMS